MKRLSRLFDNEFLMRGGGGEGEREREVDNNKETRKNKGGRGGRGGGGRRSISLCFFFSVLSLLTRSLKSLLCLPTASSFTVS